MNIRRHPIVAGLEIQAVRAAHRCQLRLEKSALSRQPEVMGWLLQSLTSDPSCKFSNQLCFVGVKLVQEWRARPPEQSKG